MVVVPNPEHLVERIARRRLAFGVGDTVDEAATTAHEHAASAQGLSIPIRRRGEPIGVDTPKVTFDAGVARLKLVQGIFVSVR